MIWPQAVTLRFRVIDPTPNSVVWMHSLVFIDSLLNCVHNTTGLWGLALREVLQDKAEVSQAVFE